MRTHPKEKHALWFFNDFSIDQLMTIFPPQMRDGLRVHLKDDPKKRKIQAWGRRIALDPGKETEFLDLVTNVSGIGPARAQHLIRPSYSSQSHWPVSWTITKHWILTDPSELLKKRTDKSLWSDKPVILFNRPVIRSLREWIMSWDD